MIATSAAFAWLLAYLKVPAMVMNTLLGLSNDPTIIILLINVILLILGMFMDMGIIILLGNANFAAGCAENRYGFDSVWHHDAAKHWVSVW